MTLPPNPDPTGPDDPTEPDDRIDPTDEAQADLFVAATTRPRPVPLVPELTLRTADDPIALWQETDVDEPPFWAFPWAGGQAVARYVLDHPDLVKDRVVLDLACGGGLIAIAAARAGGIVTAVDVDRLAITATTLNAADNGVQLSTLTMDVLEVDFLAVDALATGVLGQCEVVVAGDVFYERVFAAKAFRFLAAAAARGALVLVGDPHRAYLPPSGLQRLTGYDVAVTVELEGVSSRYADVYRIIAPGSRADAAAGQA